MMRQIKFDQESESFPIIHYTVSKELPKKVIWVRHLLILAGVFSVLSCVDKFEPIKKVAENIKETKRFLSVGRNPVEEQIMIVDVLQIAQFALGISLVLLVAVFVGIPVRYCLLYRTIPKGDAATIAKINFTCQLQVSVELVKMIWFAMANEKTELIKLPVAPSLAIIPAIAVLVLISQKDFKEFFFHHEVRSVQVEAPQPPPLPY